VEEGETLWLYGRIATAPEEMKAKLNDAIIEVSKPPKTSRGSTTGKKRTAPKTKSLKDIEIKRLSDHYQRWYSRALRVVEAVAP
jgi:hypothetical protein